MTNELTSDAFKRAFESIQRTKIGEIFEVNKTKSQTENSESQKKR